MSDPTSLLNRESKKSSFVVCRDGVYIGRRFCYYTMASIVDRTVNELGEKIKFDFKDPLILIGGGAMEFYNMRRTSHDYDFIISRRDAVEMRKTQYATYLNHFGGTVFDSDGFSTDVDSTFSGVEGMFDFAVTMFQYPHDFFLQTSLPIANNIRVVSREHLLLMKALAATNHEWMGELSKNIKKQRKDMDLIIKSIVESQYTEGAWDNAISFNQTFNVTDTTPFNVTDTTPIRF